MKRSGNSTGDWIPGLYQGDKIMFMSTPRWYVNVSDCAKLHVIALVDPACDGQRLFAFAGRYNANDILKTLRNSGPLQSFPENKEQEHDCSDIPNEDAEGLLRRYYGHG
jgi:hypothetical protein